MTKVLSQHRPPATGSLLALAADVAAFGVTAGSINDAPLAATDWDEFFEIIKGQRLSGFLHEASRSGSFVLSRGQEAELARVHLFMCARVLQLEHALVELSLRLRAAAIEHRVLKGPALAHTVYPDAAMRPYVDIDLLVRSSALDETAAWLQREGASRVHVEPRAGFVGRYGKSVELVRDDGVSVDLHCALAPGVWALLMDASDLFTEAIEIDLFDESVPGLVATDRFIHACFHATVGSVGLRLLALRDVVQCVRAPDFDAEAVRERAAAWSATTVVAVAVELAWDTLRPDTRPEIVEWAVRHQPSGRDVRLFTMKTGIADDPGISEILEMTKAIPGLRAKAGYLGALLFPTSDYLAERGQTRISRLVRGARLVRGRHDS